MNTIKKHIATKEFAKMYLLCGSDDYLRSRYCNALVKALSEGGEDMNLNVFEGDSINVDEFRATCETMPFFADRRVVLVKNSGFFSKECGLEDYVANVPDFTVIVFSESNVDKRKAMYKAVSKAGYVAEINVPDRNGLIDYARSEASKNGFDMSGRVAAMLADNCGSDLFNLNNELSKLFAYCSGQKAINVEDFNSICSVQVSIKVFELTNAIGTNDKAKVINVYGDMLAERQDSIAMIFMIARHFRILLAVADMKAKRLSNSEIIEKTGLKNDWVLKNYTSQLGAFNVDRIKKCLQLIEQANSDITSGEMTPQIALETLLMSLV